MNEKAEDFVERLSVAMEVYGLSKIAGRMLGYFLIQGGSCSLDEMADCLHISKSSASTNARHLERQGFLQRHGRPGDRRDFYRLADDPQHNVLEMVRRRMRDLSALFEEGQDALPDEMEDARGRLEDWSEFYGLVVSDMDRQLEKWEAHEAATPAGA